MGTNRLRHHCKNFPVGITKYIKLALISFFFLFLAVWAVSLLFPSQVRISRAKDIIGRPGMMFNLLEDTAHWHEWNPLFADSLKGSQEMRAVPSHFSDSSRSFKLRQPGKPDVICVFETIPTGDPRAYTLHWYMDFKLGRWPWQKFSSLFFEESYGKEMEKGLNNLNDRVVHE